MIQGWIKIDRRAAPSTETSERERAQLIWQGKELETTWQATNTRQLLRTTQYTHEDLQHNRVSAIFAQNTGVCII